MHHENWALSTKYAVLRLPLSKWFGLSPTSGQICRRVQPTLPNLATVENLWENSVKPLPQRLTELQ